MKKFVRSKITLAVIQVTIVSDRLGEMNFPVTDHDAAVLAATIEALNQYCTLDEGEYSSEAGRLKGLIFGLETGSHAEGTTGYDMTVSILKRVKAGANLSGLEVTKVRRVLGLFVLYLKELRKSLG